MHPEQKILHFKLSNVKGSKILSRPFPHWVFIDTHIWNKFFHHENMRLHCFSQVNIKYFSIVTHGSNRVHNTLNCHVRTAYASVPPKTFVSLLQVYCLQILWSKMFLLTACVKFDIYAFIHDHNLTCVEDFFWLTQERSGRGTSIFSFLRHNFLNNKHFSTKFSTMIYYRSFYMYIPWQMWKMCC